MCGGRIGPIGEVPAHASSGPPRPHVRGPGQLKADRRASHTAASAAPCRVRKAYEKGVSLESTGWAISSPRRTATKRPFPARSKRASRLPPLSPDSPRGPNPRPEPPIAPWYAPCLDGMACRPPEAPSQAPAWGWPPPWARRWAHRLLASLDSPWHALEQARSALARPHVDG